MMRILHVTDHVPPALGGIEAHVSSLAARQSRGGHRVTMLTWQRDGTRPSPGDGYGVVAARSRLEVPIDVGAFDVVHAHLSVVAPFTAPVAARLARAGLPTLVTVHSLWSGLGPVPGWVAGLSGLASAPVTWTAVGAIAAGTVRDQLRRRVAVSVLSNAVSIGPRPLTPAHERRAGDPLRVVTTMRVAGRKRPLALADILEDVEARCRRPVELSIIGDGPLVPRLTRELERRHLADRVRFTGRVEPAAVAGLVARADVYLAPARLESFGLAALEARSLGLPVVGYADSGLCEFVTHGREGLLGRSDADLADHVARLATDDALLLAMSEHNRTVSHRFTWDRALEAHDAMYEQARSRARHGEAVGWA